MPQRLLTALLRSTLSPKDDHTDRVKVLLGADAGPRRSWKGTSALYWLEALSFFDGLNILRFVFFFLFSSSSSILSNVASSSATLWFQ